MPEYQVFGFQAFHLEKGPLLRREQAGPQRLAICSRFFAAVGAPESICNRYAFQRYNMPCFGQNREQEPVIAMRKDQLCKKGRRGMSTVRHITADIHSPVF